MNKARTAETAGRFFLVSPGIVFPEEFVCVIGGIRIPDWGKSKTNQETGKTKLRRRQRSGDSYQFLIGLSGGDVKVGGHTRKRLRLTRLS
jgi:hypothetical protein